MATEAQLYEYHAEELLNNAKQTVINNRMLPLLVMKQQMIDKYSEK